MTANRRIFLNIVATYGRSLYALVIGLFCGRWTLMGRWFDGGRNGKIYDKSMNAAWQSCKHFSSIGSDPMGTPWALDMDKSIEAALNVRI